jgi:hypothetical protein
VLHHSGTGNTTTYTLTTSETIPSNITLRVENGAILDGAGTLTVNGLFECGLQQCFGSSITVSFAVGSVAPIVLNKGYKIGSQLQISTNGVTIRGNNTNIYEPRGSRSRYHLKCGFDNSAQAMIQGTGLDNGSLVLRHLNIDMDDNTTTAINNEDQSGDSTKRVKMDLHRITIDNCGKHGIVIQDGGGASRIDHCYLAGLSTASNTDGTDIVSGSIGIHIAVNAADCWVTNNEVKGLFDNGISIDGTNAIISNNNFDLNNVGAMATGAFNTWTANRFAKNFGKGMQIGSAGGGSGRQISVTGNKFYKNNTDTSLTTGSYDGVGISCYGVTDGTINANVFEAMDYGIQIDDGETSFFLANVQNDLDSTLFDYSSNTGTTEIILQTGGLIERVEGTSATSKIEMTDSGVEFPTQTAFIGTNDTTVGELFLQGHATGSTAGGRLVMRLAADHDGTINQYEIRGLSDDLYIGPDTNTNALRYDGTNSKWLFDNHVAPSGNGTLDFGVQTTAQWANVWSDLINGSDYSFLNRWRILESDKYEGYPPGIAIGSEGFKDGVVTEKMSRGLKPLFALTEDFIEYKGVRFTIEKLKKLLGMLN